MTAATLESDPVESGLMALAPVATLCRRSPAWSLDALRNIREPIPLLRVTVSDEPSRGQAVSAAERRQSLATGASPWEPFSLCNQPRQGRKIRRENLTLLF
jgi:hypothetical protein